MPTYEYECPKCGVVEAYKAMKEPHPTRCPQCKGRDLARIFNANVVPSVDSQWKDHYIPQLGKEYLDPYTKTKKNPASHFNSLNEVRECVKKRGQDIIL